MALRKDGTLLGYSASIAEVIGSDNDNLLDLVDDFMRGRTGGTLDALPADDFDHLALQAIGDIITWSLTGAINGTTLHDYCAILGLTYPACLDEHGTIVAAEI